MNQWILSLKGGFALNDCWYRLSCFYLLLEAYSNRCFSKRETKLFVIALVSTKHFQVSVKYFKKKKIS